MENLCGTCVLVLSSLSCESPCVFTDAPSSMAPAVSPRCSTPSDTCGSANRYALK